MAQQPKQRVRIIGGQWKRTPLHVPNLPGLRPTPDRVRETLFNWLGQSLNGWVCLDVFGGTGALGFEAASRGATQVLINEPQRDAAQAIVRTVEKLAATQITVLRQDAEQLLAQYTRQGQRFHLVFLDPPFGQGWLEKIFPRLAGILAPQAYVYVEAEQPISPPTGYQLCRQDKAGAVYYHLLQYAL